MQRSFFYGLSLAVLALSVGCQEPKYFPVSGKLLDENGQPLTELAGAQISFESVDQPVSAVAEAQPDGSFHMTTENPHDGCLPGEHRVSIGRIYYAADNPGPIVIDHKYEQYETSGLVVNVEKKSNTVELKLERIKPN